MKLHLGIIGTTSNMYPGLQDLLYSSLESVNRVLGEVASHGKLSKTS